MYLVYRHTVMSSFTMLTDVCVRFKINEKRQLLGNIDEMRAPLGASNQG